MNNQEYKFEWNELKDIWTDSAQTGDILIKFNSLVDEIKGKASQFEKNAIKKDLETLKANWKQYEAGISQFEKDSINKDLASITSLLKKFINLFKKNS